MGSRQRRCGLGSLWIRLLGLLSHHRLHLGFRLSLGLAALPLRRLELLLLRLGMGPRRLRRMVSGHCCARTSSGMDDAEPAAASGRYSPGRGAATGGGRSWPGSHRTVGTQQRIQTDGESSAGFEFQRSDRGAGGEDRGTSGVCRGQGHGSGIARGFEWRRAVSTAAKSGQFLRVGREPSPCVGKPQWPIGTRVDRAPGGTSQRGLPSASGAAGAG
jgi:hypothetical protein